MLLGYFCNQICWQELSKIAQSGHTEVIPTNARNLSGERRLKASLELDDVGAAVVDVGLRDVIRQTLPTNLGLVPGQSFNVSCRWKRIIISFLPSSHPMIRKY